MPYANGNIQSCHADVSVRANISKYPPPVLLFAILRKKGIASRPYGGLHHTRLPVQSTASPSSGRLTMRVAVRHGICGGQQGSRSNGPSASMICGGVSHVFSPESTFIEIEGFMPILLSFSCRVPVVCPMLPDSTACANGRQPVCRQVRPETSSSRALRCIISPTVSLAGCI